MASEKPSETSLQVLNKLADCQSNWVVVSSLSSAALQDPVATPRQPLAIVVLAIAAFVIVTTEFLMVGLLPALARDFHVSVSLAGQLVTLFAVVVMLFGPPLTAWLGHIERKRLFVGILVLFAVANGLAGVGPNI